MRRLVRASFVLCTTFAAFVATSLQGKVLCFSDCGSHVAFEAPHADAGCSAGHEGHGHPVSPPDDESSGCTDLSADFPMIREVAAAVPIDAQSADFAPVWLFATSTDCPAALAEPSRGAAPGSTHPPALLELRCLRTIILLV